MVDRVDWVYHHLISARIQASEAALVAQKPLASLGKFGPLLVPHGDDLSWTTPKVTIAISKGISWDFI